MKKTLILCLMACACLCAQAKGKKKTAQAEKPDTVCIDTFSYAAGKANTMGLKDYLVQRMDVDTTYMADFLAGFDAAEMTEADKRQKARLAGLEIRSQVQGQIMPQVASQICDTVDLLNHALFVAGFRTGVSGQDDKMPLSPDSIQRLVKKQVDYYHAQQMEAKYGPTRREGEAFLAANAKRDSVVVTPSGLQYKILTKGEGAVPTASQKVKVHYRGTLLDGTEFDSSYKRGQPATFACNQVIKGWTEALTMMPVGSKWMLYIPQQLAYGDRDSGKIPPYSMLTFEVELIDIVK